MLYTKGAGQQKETREPQIIIKNIIEPRIEKRHATNPLKFKNLLI